MNSLLSIHSSGSGSKVSRVSPAPGPVLQANTEFCNGANGSSGISTAVRPDITCPSKLYPDTICLLSKGRILVSN